METQNGLGFWGAVGAVVVGGAMIEYLRPIGFGDLNKRIGHIDEVAYRLDEKSLSLVRDVNSMNSRINQLLQRPTLELKTENVLGNKTPEQFYEIAGKRVYLTIDGQPVEQYFQK